MFDERSNETLVLLTLAGDSGAYETLVKKYEQAVYASALSVTRAHHLAEDAAQDAFVSAWMKLNALSEPSKFGAWVCRIAENCAKNTLARFHAFLPLEDVEWNASSDVSSPEEDLIASEQQKEIRETVARLPERVRKVIELHYFSDLPIDKIPEILEAVELSDVANHRISSFSGGMKQRLALAQAVLGDPAVLILDEPTAGLDPKQRIAIRNYISRIAFNKIVIIATHVVSDVEYIARDVIMLKKGVITDNAPPAELLKKIEGQVWSVPAREEEVQPLQERFRVTNILKNDESVSLRILSEEKPTENAKPVQPTLEDYYLYVFGELTR